MNVGWILVVLMDAARANLPGSSTLANEAYTEGYG